MKEIVSRTVLKRATKRVIAELKSLGLWDDLMDEVGVICWGGCQAPFADFSCMYLAIPRPKRDDFSGARHHA
jgi:hypothetical protein